MNYQLLGCIYFEILNRSFMKKLVLFFYLFFSVTYLFSQQNIVVRGTVTDEQNQAIPGVSVMIQGTVKGMVTDSDGKYSIEAPSNGTLRFSFLGYKPQEISVNNRSVINVRMESSVVSMQEYVIVG
jgi:hypothetical protein